MKRIVTIFLLCLLYLNTPTVSQKTHLHKIVCDKLNLATLNCGLSYPIRDSLEEPVYVPFLLDFTERSGMNIIHFNNTSHMPMIALFKSTGRNLRHLVITSSNYQPFFSFQADIKNMTSHFEQEFQEIDITEAGVEQHSKHFLNEFEEPIVSQIKSPIFDSSENSINQTTDDKLQLSLSNKMTFNFINLGRIDIKLDEITSNGMSEWKDTIPQLIQTGQTKSFSIEFGIQIFSSNSGLAKFSYGSLAQAITIEAKDSAFCFTFSEQLYKQELNIWTFPPPLKNNASYKISLLNEATLSIGLFDFYQVYSELQQPAQSESEFIANYFHYIKPIISTFTLRELFITGTHDSGTYNMKNKLTEYWCKDQNLDIKGQLQAGARVIDVRSGDLGKDSASIEDQFIFVHGDFDGGVRQYDGMMMVKQFLDSHPDEIVIVDIAQQKSRTSEPYNQQNQTKMLLSVFDNQDQGSYLIPQEYFYKQIGKIYSELSPKQRLILSWGSGSKDQGFWDSLRQMWDGNSISSVSKVETYLNSVFHGTLPSDKLWSAQAEIWTILQGPTYISPYLENWFYSYGDWASKSYIVNIDYIEETLVPEHGIMNNMVRSSQLGQIRRGKLAGEAGLQ